MSIYTIIVTYNGLKWIDKTLKSLQASSLKSTIVVVDNQSNDGTYDFIARNFADVILVKAEENLGFGRANNVGIEIALKDKELEHVFLLNQDASVEPDTLSNLVQCSKEHNNYGIISPIHLNGEGSDLDFNFSIYASPQFCEGFFSAIYRSVKPEVLYETKFVNAAAWLIKSNVLHQVGGFNPIFFMYGEDDDYINRVKYNGYKIGICTTTNIYHDRPQRQKRKRSHYNQVKYDFHAKKMIKFMDFNKSTISTVSAFKLESFWHIIKGCFTLNKKEIQSGFWNFGFLMKQGFRILKYKNEAKKECAFLNKD